MNASGRPNTCKSRGGNRESLLSADDRRTVRNAYTIYLSLRDSPKKFGLIPHSIIEPHGFVIKGYGDR